MADKAPDLRLFATIPPSSGPGHCPEAVRGAATRTAAVDFSGALVRSDNDTVDPREAAQEVSSVAEGFPPLVAGNASGSTRVARLSAAQEFPGGPESPCWRGPFLNHATHCPYLAGSHEKGAGEIRRCLDAGCGTVVPDAACEDDDHAMDSAVFDRALSR
ncbi:hypothetical protein L1856_09280 [Streptomyces sp. Tue 6430]|nr:hypothetical protein [Streptomyces sp. Tue 6430]